MSGDRTRASASELRQREIDALREKIRFPEIRTEQLGFRVLFEPRNEADIELE